MWYGCSGCISKQKSVRLIVICVLVKIDFIFMFFKVWCEFISQASIIYIFSFFMKWTILPKTSIHRSTNRVHSIHLKQITRCVRITIVSTKGNAVNPLILSKICIKKDKLNNHPIRQNNILNISKAYTIDLKNTFDKKIIYYLVYA